MTVKKVLFCATVDVHFQKFHLPYLRWFKEQGWEVHVAASGEMQLPYADHKFQLRMERSPLHWHNAGAYRALKRLIREHRYDLIHCHTPMGGVLARLAARKMRRLGTKVIYTAHGFHFYQGASFLSWMIYYPVEKVLSMFTDCLVTINEEDYGAAGSRRFRAKHIEHIHGVGVDTEKFRPVNLAEKARLREKCGYDGHLFLLCYAAEFNANKNQQLLIRAMSVIQKELPHVKLLLAGEGPLLHHCTQLARSLGVESQVDFLGYREDVEHVLQMCDAAISSSHREGLPVNIMEAMACALPIIAMTNRGHRELVHHQSNGLLVQADDVHAMAESIQALATQPLRCQAYGQKGRQLVESKYSLDRVMKEHVRMYLRMMDVGAEEAEELQCATP